jgi:hypothetical protein
MHYDINHINLSEKPVLVFNYKGKLYQEQCEILRNQLKAAFEGTKIVILENGLSLTATINDLIQTDGY